MRALGIWMLGLFTLLAGFCIFGLVVLGIIMFGAWIHKYFGVAGLVGPVLFFFALAQWGHVPYEVGESILNARKVKK